MDWNLVLTGIADLLSLLVILILSRPLWQRRREPATAVFLATLAAFSLSALYDLGNLVAQSLVLIFPTSPLSPWRGIVYRLWPFSDAALLLASALWFHFFLVYPQRHPWLRRSSWPLAGLYGPVALLATSIVVLAFLPAGLQATLQRPSELIEQAAIVLGGLALLGGMCMLWRSYRRTPPGRRRRELRSLLLGLSTGVAVVVGTYLVPLLSGGPVPMDVFPLLQPLTLLGILSTFLFTIVRYQLFDVRLVLSRSVAYAAATVILVGLYVALVIAAVYLLGRAIRADDPFLLATLSLLAIAVLNPLRQWMQERINQFFYLHRYDYRQVVREFGQDLRRLQELSVLMWLVLNRVTQIWQLQTAALVLHDEQDELYSVGEVQGLPEKCLEISFSPQAEVVRRLIAHGQALELQREAKWVAQLPPAERELLDQLYSQLLVPLWAKDRLIGWLNLGEKLSEQPYTGGDIELLTTLADQAGVALENASLYERRRREVAALEALNRIGLAANVMELPDLLEQIYNEVTSLVDAPNFYIALYDSETQTLSYAFHIDDGVRQPIEEDSRWSAGEGLTSEIVRSGQPIVTDDYLAECQRRGVQPPGRDRERQGLSWLGVPLLEGPRVLGVLSISSPRESTIYRSEHVRLLSTLAAQAAVAIERARLRTREQQRAAELATLNTIAQAIGSTIDLDTLLQIICHAVQGILDAPNLYIALFDAVHGELTFSLYVEDGQPQEPPQRSWALGTGLSSEIVRLRQPILTNDYPSECERRGIRPEDPPARAWLGVPMVVGEKIVGVLVVSSFDSETSYNEEDARLLSTIAAQAGGAVQNARLYQESRRRLEELAALFQVGAKIISTLDLQEVLDAVCQEAALLLKATSAYITEWDDSRQITKVISEYITPEAAPQERVSDLNLTYVEEDVFAELLRQGLPFGGHRSSPDLPAYIREHLEQFGGQSVLFLPLVVRGQVHGQIEVWESRYERTFTEDETLLGQHLASLAALAIENARLYARADAALSRRVEELVAIEEITRELNTALDFSRVIEVVLDRAMDATGAMAGAVALLTLDKKRLYLLTSRGYPAQLADYYRTHPWSVEEGVIGRVVRTRRPALITNVQQDRDYVRARISTVSEAAVPITHAGEVIGVIALENDRPAAFDEEHIHFLQRLAEHAGIAIRNARLFEERERRITQLAILNETGRVLSSALELDELLETVYDQVGRLFDTANFYIATYEEVPGEWEAVLNVEKGNRMPPERHEVGAGLTGYIIRNKVPLLFRKASEVEAFENEAGIRPVGELPHSWLGVPLIAAEKVVGVMGIESYEHENLYSEEDLALFSAIAAQVAITVEKARLFRGVTDVRDRLQAILDSTRDGILMLSEEGRVLQANPPIEQWLGLSQDEIVGAPLSEVIRQSTRGHPEVRRIVTAELERASQALATESQRSLSGKLEGLGRSSQTFEWFTQPVLDQKGSQIGRILVLRDVTTAREAERMREDLVSMIVHDLRGPLTAILGALETLLQQDTRPLSEIQRTLIELAQEGGRHMLGLVNTLLDIRRLEAGKMPLLFAPVHLADIVARVIAQLEPLVQERRLTVSKELPADLPLVRADQEKIARVFENLLHNALKYSYPGGVIRVRAETGSDAVRCEVVDYGVGIPKAEQERIFDKFVQVHRSGAPRGTGLGLAFCRLTVEAHGGRIWVESEEGKGTTFNFTVPVWKE